jgi:hypothetical protein
VRHHVPPAFETGNIFDCSTAFAVPSAEQISNLVRALNAPDDRDALAACRQLGATLRNAGGLNGLGRLIEVHWVDPKRPEPKHARPTWQVRAEAALRHPENLIREMPDEFDFLGNVSRMHERPTPSQMRWLADVERGIREGLSGEQRQQRRWRAA